MHHVWTGRKASGHKQVLQAKAARSRIGAARAPFMLRRRATQGGAPEEQQEEGDPVLQAKKNTVRSLLRGERVHPFIPKDMAALLQRARNEVFRVLVRPSMAVLRVFGSSHSLRRASSLAIDLPAAISAMPGANMLTGSVFCLSLIHI